MPHTRDILRLGAAARDGASAEDGAAALRTLLNVLLPLVDIAAAHRSRASLVVAPGGGDGGGRTPREAAGHSASATVNHNFAHELERFRTRLGDVPGGGADVHAATRWLWSRRNACYYEMLLALDSAATALARRNDAAGAKRCAAALEGDLGRGAAGLWRCPTRCRWGATSTSRRSAPPSPIAATPTRGLWPPRTTTARAAPSCRFAATVRGCGALRMAG